MKEDEKEVKEENNQIKFFQCTYGQYQDRDNLTPKPLTSDKADQNISIFIFKEEHL